MKFISIKVADVEYGPEEIKELATEVAKIRNMQLDIGSMTEAVVLSHAIGVLNVIANSWKE